MRIGQEIANVNLTKTEDVKNFCTLLSQIESDVFLYCEGYVVDAKSIMGILTLDRSKKIQMNVVEKREGEIEQIKNMLADYLLFTE